MGVLDGSDDRTRIRNASRVLSLNQALIEQRLADLASSVIGTTSEFINSFAALYNVKTALECVAQIDTLGESELFPSRRKLIQYVDSLCERLEDTVAEKEIVTGESTDEEELLLE